MAALTPLLSMTITTFLVIVLARAAWHKADRFLETVGFAQGYGLVPNAWTGPIVRVLMIAEASAILAILVPGLRPVGAIVAAGLFAGYGLLMAIALWRGRSYIDCGCGGPAQIVSGFTLTRNAVLMGLALLVVALPATTVPPVEAASAIAGGLVLSAIYVVGERLASHLPYIRQKG